MDACELRIGNFCGQISLNDAENDSVGDVGLKFGLEEGLGLFDAFFASLSMIIVSEVSLTTLFMLVFVTGFNSWRWRTSCLATYLFSS